MHLKFIAALFTITKIRKQPKCLSTDEWIKKIHTHTHTYIHTHKMGYYSAIKRRKFCHLQQHEWTWRAVC